MEPWTAIKKGLPQCGGDTSSCPGPYPTAACPEFHIGCRLGRELFTLPTYNNLNCIVLMNNIYVAFIDFVDFEILGVICSSGDTGFGASNLTGVDEFLRKYKSSGRNYELGFPSLKTFRLFLPINDGHHLSLCVWWVINVAT